uniref:Putative secreted protein n=1 Tax=Ixodes ricinus TaxID=34613 RepID=A0A6B0ULK4_IXORI
MNPPMPSFCNLRWRFFLSSLSASSLATSSEVNFVSSSTSILGSTSMSGRSLLPSSESSVDRRPRKAPKAPARVGVGGGPPEGTRGLRALCRLGCSMVRALIWCMPDSERNTPSM